MSALRYDNATDWVEIMPGIAKKSMKMLAMLDADLVDGHKLAVGWTADAHFTAEDGTVVAWRDDPLGLTPQQWNWWKTSIWRAARDERVSPEA